MPHSDDEEQQYNEEEQNEEEKEQEEQPEDGEQEQPEEEDDTARAEQGEEGEGEGEGEGAKPAEAGPPKRKALLIGCNYPDSGSPLKGCIADVENMKAFLLERLYEEENIVVLTDDQEDEETRPTRENIINRMKELVEGAVEGDSFVVHFSGHGDGVKDEDGDEHDGRDEVILPCDHEESGTLSDDIMHEILVKPLPFGSRLTVIFDCCHSGSALDLPYMYNDEGTIKEPNQEDAMKSLAHHVANDDVDAIVKAAEALQLRKSGEADRAHAKTMATRTSWADVYFLSGCQDEQVSADANEDGQSTGAMTWGLMQVIREDSDQTYKSLLAGIREALDGKNYHQRPQLSTSYAMDLNRKFDI